MRSAGPVDVGVDGEALTLPPPLHFVIRPGADGPAAAHCAKVVAPPRAPYESLPSPRWLRCGRSSSAARMGSDDRLARSRSGRGSARPATQRRSGPPAATCALQCAAFIATVKVRAADCANPPLSLVFQRLLAPSPVEESVPRPPRDVQPVRDILCGPVVSGHRRAPSPTPK